MVGLVRKKPFVGDTRRCFDEKAAPKSTTPDTQVVSALTQHIDEVF